MRYAAALAIAVSVAVQILPCEGSGSPARQGIHLFRCEWEAYRYLELQRQGGRGPVPEYYLSALSGHVPDADQASG